MVTIKKGEYAFSVDIERTKAYYKALTVCDCADCRNYYAQVKDKFPKLNCFLAEFGVDALKPDEAVSVETNSCVNYLSVVYTVCGSIETMGKGEIVIYDNVPLNISVADGFVIPNMQSEHYFTLSVEEIQLPWVLDEPFPESATQTPLKIKSIVKRIFGK